MATGKITRPYTDSITTAWYTPYWGYTKSGKTLTVENVQAFYAKIGQHLCLISARFNITDKGTYNSTENFVIGLPDGMFAASNTYAPCGVHWNSNGPTNLILRLSEGVISETNSGYINVVSGMGGNYSAPVIQTGYQGFFAVIPIQ